MTEVVRVHRGSSVRRVPVYRLHELQRGSLQVVMKDRASDKPRGFGFVTFVDEAVADKVCEEKHELQGRQVCLQYSCCSWHPGACSAYRLLKNLPMTSCGSSDRC